MASTNYAYSALNGRDENRFKFTSFDELINPLRADHPFGKQTHNLPYFTYLYNTEFS
jgi:hypothetical protein